jgi:hypothetical protein
MILDRPLAEQQRIGNFPVVDTACHQPKHILFPLG